jgi:hypothetical protein
MYGFQEENIKLEMSPAENVRNYQYLREKDNIKCKSKKVSRVCISKYKLP